MRLRDPSHEEHLEVGARDRDDALDATSDEVFDRLAFAERALAVVRPGLERLVVCSASSGAVEVELGRLWGRGTGARWAIVTVPAHASRRAIALAAASVAGTSARPWSLDLLLGDASTS